MENFMNTGKEKVRDLMSKAKGKRRRMIAAAAVFVLLLGAVSFVAARYITNRQKENQIHASDFHFSSNYLEYKEDGSAAPEALKVSDWGDHSISILLYNYEKENVALISESAIQYTVKVSDGWTVEITDAAGKAVSEKEGVYTMPESEICTNQTLTLSYTGEGEPEKAEVTVSSTSPYAKELTREFELSVKRAPDYTVTDMGDYVVVSIETNDYHGELQVGWNGENLAPDNTNGIMAAWKNTGAESEGRFQVEEFNTYHLIFLEQVSGEYEKQAITVTHDSGNSAGGNGE